MKSFEDLDRLLLTMDVSVEGFTLSEVGLARRCDPAPANGIIVLYVVAGTLILDLRGRESRTCPTNTLILLPPGIEARLTAADEAPLKLAGGIVFARLSGAFGLLDRAKAPIVEDMTRSQIVRQVIGAILAELARPQTRLGSAALVNALMKVCLMSVLRRFFQRPGIDHKIISALADPRLAGAIASILDRPGSPHTVASLAARGGLSRSTFARMFTEALGMSPMEFVGKARLHQAAGLLRLSRMPIKSIAANVGFSSRSHFSRAFRNAYGCDPSAYRREQATEVPAPEPRALPDIPEAADIIG